MPAVFVLFGAGLFFLKKNYARRRTARNTAGPACGFVLAGLNFVLYYCAAAATKHCDYGAFGGIPRAVVFSSFSPKPAPTGAKAADLLTTFPYYTAGYTVLAKLAGSAGILTGTVGSLFGTGSERGAVGAGSAGAGVYWSLPVSGSTLLSRVCWCGRFRWCCWYRAPAGRRGGRWDTGHKHLRVLWLVLWIATVGLHKGVISTSMQTVCTVEEIRPVLDAIARDFRPGDVLYVHHEAWPAVAYYRECHARRAAVFFRKQRSTRKLGSNT
jgi:hypothetical protein